MTSQLARQVRWLVALGAALVSWGCEAPPENPPPPAKVPVTSEVLEAAPFQARLRLLGVVAPAQRVELRTREAGRVRYAPRFAQGLRVGERVDKGELLFVLENDDIELQVAEAKLQAQGAAAELERARRGVEGGFLPEMDLKNREIQMSLAQERLANAEARRARLRHHAPAAGTLGLDSAIPPGAELSSGQLVARLAASGHLIVETWAAAKDLPSLDIGLAVECLLPVSGQLAGRGRLREVAREVDPAGTVQVIAVVDEDLGMPRPGEGVEIEVLLPLRQGVVTVPEQALLIEAGVSRGFVLAPKGSDYRAELRLVQTGQRSGDRLEIVYGMQAGDRVAVRGAEFLADGLLAVDAGSSDGKTPQGQEASQATGGQGSGR